LLKITLTDDNKNGISLNAAKSSSANFLISNEILVYLLQQIRYTCQPLKEFQVF
jgi:hypothetical protein